jgi:hypothetical protein
MYILYSSKADAIMEIARLLTLLFFQVHDEGFVIFFIVKVFLEERSWSLPLVCNLIKNEFFSFIIFIISSALLPCPWLIEKNVLLVLVVVVIGHLVSNTFTSIDNGGCPWRPTVSPLLLMAGAASRSCTSTLQTGP